MKQWASASDWLRCCNFRCRSFSGSGDRLLDTQVKMMAAELA